MAWLDHARWARLPVCLLAHQVVRIHTQCNIVMQHCPLSLCCWRYWPKQVPGPRWASLPDRLLDCVHTKPVLKIQCWRCLRCSEWFWLSCWHAKGLEQGVHIRHPVSLFDPAAGKALMLPGIPQNFLGGAYALHASRRRLNNMVIVGSYIPLLQAWH